MENYKCDKALTCQNHSREEDNKRSGEQPDLEGCPRSLFLSQRRNPQPLHRSLAITAFQLFGDRVLHFINHPNYVRVGVEMRGFHFLLTKLSPVGHVQQLEIRKY